MTSNDDDEPPESDPYCAHWRSVYEEDHDVTCEQCGHSCKDHQVLWGLWCSHGCDCQFENDAWPSEQTEPLKDDARKP